MLEPTRNFERFMLAEQTGRTVRELLTGERGPLTAMEAFLWRRFSHAKNRLQTQGVKRK